MKRIMTLATALLLLLCAACPVAADNGTQQIALSEFDGTLMLSAKNQPTSWELIDLKAGEATDQPGMLVLENNTKRAHTISLNYVGLPFDNEAALAYLQHVNITVAGDSGVLYDGPYTRINDENGLRINRLLQPGEAATLSISVRCDYTLDNAVLPAGGVLTDWKFFTMVQQEVEDGDKVSAAFSDPALREILIAVAAAAALLIGVGVYEFSRRRRR